MRASANSLIKNISTGFVVLFFLSLLLFWLRWFCNVYLVENLLPESAKSVSLQPSKLIPEEIENEPNVANHSSITASFHNPMINSLGFFDYMSSLTPIGDNSNIYWFDFDSSENKGEALYFDEKIGQIVYQHYSKEISNDYIERDKTEILYAGPEGISETYDKKLGRFLSPVRNALSHYSYIVTIYDNNTRRFYTIDFDEKSIIKGPQLSEDDIHKPVQIGLLQKNPEMLYLNWQSVLVDKNTEDKKHLNTQLVSVNVNEAELPWFPYLLVLDETGRIDFLDKKKLDFVDFSGDELSSEFKLPTDRREFLAYKVLPLAVGPEGKFNGMYIACINRDGTAITLDVYDAEGKMVTIKTSEIRYYDSRGREIIIPSNQAIHFNIPWGPAVTITRYLLESLQSPILSFVSYLSANSFDAGSGHMALFILPDSFIAMPGRFIKNAFNESFLSFLLLMLPSVILSFILAGKVGKDATISGFSHNERMVWITGTLAFGLAAYITYRLVKPKTTLVTCQNCGKPRRPDMDKCHRCKSSWHVPELTPPSWRVVDS